MIYTIQTIYTLYKLEQNIIYYISIEINDISILIKLSK